MGTDRGVVAATATRKTDCARHADGMAVPPAARAAGATHADHVISDRGSPVKPHVINFNGVSGYPSTFVEPWRVVVRHSFHEISNVVIITR